MSTSLSAQTNLILSSYKHWLGKDLVPSELSQEEKVKALYEAPFVVVSHGTEADPIFNYANLCAQKLWEVSWNDFIQMPSKKSVEASLRDDRSQLLNSLKNSGYSNDYRGTRISSSGTRFDIIDACVFNLIDEHGNYKGQAATFENWEFL
jgi:hypothetical protein